MADLEVPEDVTSRVARLLRHEVGDLLQVVYSTASILAARLGPGLDLERQLVAGLKGRAEQVKADVDAVVRLVTPGPYARSPVDLSAAAEAAVTRLRREQPPLPVTFLSEGPSAVWADPNALASSLALLLAAVSRQAKAVDVRVDPGDRTACRVGRSGPPPSADQLEWLRRPFTSTHGSHLGLALASCARVAAEAGGAIEARQEGAWFVVVLSLPPVGS